MDLDPDPDRDTSNTCLGGGMHCPSASSIPTFTVRLGFVLFYFYV